jgi:hypothetical protein
VPISRHHVRPLPPTHADHPWLSHYAKHTPTLVIGIIGYVVVGYLLVTIQPTTVQHILFANSYLPFHIVWFIANFFLFSFLLLNSRRGYIVAVGLGILGFLKLQRFELSAQFLIVLLVLFVIIEILGTILEKSVFSHASFHPKPYSGRRRPTF